MDCPDEFGDASGTHIGSHCSITHHCTMHGCTIGDNCLIGVNSTTMDGCVIGDNCIVAGHSFLKEGTVIPPSPIVMGAPGKVTRTENSFVRNRRNAYLDYRNALAYAVGPVPRLGPAGFPIRSRGGAGPAAGYRPRLMPQDADGTAMSVSGRTSSIPDKPDYAELLSIFA